MSTLRGTIHRGMAGAALLATMGLLAGPASQAADEDAGARVTPVFATKLPDTPGKSLSAILVSYAPGGKSGAHHHAGSVFAYVLSGAIRSENSATGPVKVYQAGESFFEEPGAVHRISRNASETKPAKLLAVFIADSNDQALTTPIK